MKFSDFADKHLLDLGHTIQFAGGIWSSEGKLYICLLPDEDVNLPQEFLEMTQEEWTEFLLQTDVLNVEALVEGENGKIAKAIFRKSQRQIAQNVSWQVFRRDAYHCRYCGRGDVPLTVDHLVLWEDGGPSIPENLVAADKRCNKTRGNLPYGQWLNHPYYKKVSRNLTEEQREKNRALLGTLPNIPRMIHKPKHR